MLLPLTKGILEAQTSLIIVNVKPVRTIMVGASCAVATCSNTYSRAKKRGHLLSLHSFPKDPDLKALWIAACSRADYWNPDTSFVCSDHFALDDFISDQRLQLWTGIKWRPLLKSGVIPTKNLARTRCSKYSKRRNTSKERHQMFSMFQVVSIELESRLKKMNNVQDPHDEANSPSSPNVGNSERVETGQGHWESSTGPTMDCTDSNQDTSHPMASDSKHSGSDSENDDTSLTEFPSTEYAYSESESPSLNQDPPDLRGSLNKKIFRNDEVYDKNARESNLGPVNGKIVYSCSAYELFVDDD